MRGIASTLCALGLLAGVAHSQPQPVKILVLPLDHPAAVGDDAVALFGQRLLVALEQAGRFQAITPDEVVPGSEPGREPTCVRRECLVRLGQAAGAARILAGRLLPEQGKYAGFVTLYDAATGQVLRRRELGDLSYLEVTRGLAADIASWAGAGKPAPRAARLALAAVPELARDPVTAALLAELSGRLAGGRVAIAGAGDSAASHRGEVSAELTLERRRHHIRHYLDGTLTATLVIRDAAGGQTVFSQQISATLSRRARESTPAELTALLVRRVVDGWQAAYRAHFTEDSLLGRTP